MITEYQLLNSNHGKRPVYTAEGTFNTSRKKMQCLVSEKPEFLRPSFFSTRAKAVTPFPVIFLCIIHSSHGALLSFLSRLFKSLFKTSASQSNTGKLAGARHIYANKSPCKL